MREPQVGDLLLCEVVSIGIHGRVETGSGSREKLYVGDRIVCAVANRYATSLLEAVAEIGDGEVDMISASGLCGRVVARAKKAAAPTKLRVLGQAFVESAPLNLRTCMLESPPHRLGTEPRWVVVVGSAMDSGKTTACAAIAPATASAKPATARKSRASAGRSAALLALLARHAQYRAREGQQSLLADRLRYAADLHPHETLRGEKEVHVAVGDQGIWSKETDVLRHPVDREDQGRARNVIHPADRALLKNGTELAAGRAPHHAAVRQILEVT